MNRSSLKTIPPDLRWNESNHPVSLQYGDVYFSADDPLAESTYVFLEGNHLQAGSSFLVAEPGFGTGLNFLNCWRLWHNSPGKHGNLQKLHYIGIEHSPIGVAEMRSVHRQWPELTPFSEQLLQIYDDKSAGWHRFELSGQICLDLFFGDALQELSLRPQSDKPVDAWFLDGFSPDRNADLWSQALFDLMALHSHAATTLATYSSAGFVRRRLAAAGFDVHRRPGFGRKRHMLVATGLNHSPSPKLAGYRQPWFRFSSQQRSGRNSERPVDDLTDGGLPHQDVSAISTQQTVDDRRVIVIGAGLAGANAAFALAKRNFQVSVLEQNHSLDAGCNAIPQMALRCRLFKQAGTDARFYLQAYLHAARTYASLNSRSNTVWHGVGVLQHGDAINKGSRPGLEEVTNIYAGNVVTSAADHPHFSHSAHANQAVASLRDSLWFPGGGWVNPVALCDALLDSHNISVQFAASAARLAREHALWQVCDAGGELLAEAPVVVVAAGAGLNQFPQFRNLPLELRVGQSTGCVAREPEFSAGIKSVISGQRSIFPAVDNRHTISGSYRQPATDASPLPANDQANLDAIALMFGLASDDELTRISSHTAVRVNSADRLPIVGPVPDTEAMIGQYGALGLNAKKQFAAPGRYLDGLYVSAAHGSSGAATTALAGEYLAALINGESLPVNSAIMDLLNPCRFLIRDLKRQRL